MSYNEFCAQRGHCHHEEGGVQYQRHAGRAQGTVEVTCCHCGQKNRLPMHAKSRAGTPMTLKHGPFSGLPDTPPKTAA